MKTLKTGFADNLLNTNQRFKNIIGYFSVLDIKSKGENMNSKKELPVFLNLNKILQTILPEN